MNNIKAEPGYYVLSLEELDNGQVVLSKHPVIAFNISAHLLSYPITVMNLPCVQTPTLLTPDGVVYEENCVPCDLKTHIECLRVRHRVNLEFHMSMDRVLKQ